MQCGNELPADVKFCPNCGAPTTPRQITSAPTSQTESNPKESSHVERNIIAVALILMICVVVAFSIARQPVSTPQSQSTSQPLQWATIATFSGSASKDSEDFNVPTSYWRVVYTVNAENEQYGAFHVLVYPSGETVSYVASVNLNGSGTDTSYIRADPGGFWFKVLAANLVSWTIEVQIQK